MAIAFARMQILSRRARHDTTARFCYIARLDETRVRSDLLADPVTLVPAETPPYLTGLSLWQANEKVAPRADSIVGFELVLALPTFHELPLLQACALVEQFCAGMIVANGLGVTIAIHGPHGRQIAEAEAKINSEATDAPSLGELVDATLNWPHAHVLGTPRAIGLMGFSPRRSNLLEPLVRGTGPKRTVLCAVPWGPIWTQYQNAALASARSSQRVRLVAPHRGQHIGPARAIALLESDLDQGLIPIEQRPRVNREIEARNKQSFEELHAVRPDQPVFQRADLKNLLSRYLDRNAELESRTDLYLETIAAIPLLDPSTGEAISWFTTSSTVESCNAIVSLARSVSLQTRAAPIAASISQVVERLERDPVLIGAVEDVARGRGIVTLEMEDLGSNLPALDEIFRHVGCNALHVGHKSMTLAALGRGRAGIVIPSQFEKQIGSGAVVILDRADALALDDLLALLQTLEARRGQLVLIRRPHTLPFPRTVVMDRIASFGPLHQIGSWSAPALLNRQALVDRQLGLLVDILRAGRFRLFSDEETLLAYAARALQSDHAPRVAPVDTDMATRLAKAAGRQSLPYPGGDDPHSGKIIMALPGHHLGGPLFENGPQDQTALLIDLARIPSLAALFTAAALSAEDMRLPFAAAWTGGQEQTNERGAGFSLALEVSALYFSHFERLFETTGEGDRRAENTLSERQRQYCKLAGEALERVFPSYMSRVRHAAATDVAEPLGMIPLGGKM